MHRSQEVQGRSNYLFVSFCSVKASDGTYSYRLKASGSPVSYSCVLRHLKFLSKTCEGIGIEMPKNVGLHSFCIGAIQHMESQGINLHAIQKQQGTRTSGQWLIMLVTTLVICWLGLF